MRSYSRGGSDYNSASSTVSKCSCSVSPLRCFSMAFFHPGPATGRFLYAPCSSPSSASLRMLLQAAWVWPQGWTCCPHTPAPAPGLPIHRAAAALPPRAAARRPLFTEHNLAHPIWLRQSDILFLLSNFSSSSVILDPRHLQPVGPARSWSFLSSPRRTVCPWPL